MLKASVTTPKANGPESGKAGGMNKKKNHPFYIASLFDVFAQLESDVQGTWGFRHSHMTIVTRDPDAEDSMEWVIRGSAYGALDIVLEVDGVYFLKGRLIALNQPGEQKFYYEPKNQILATTSNELKGDLANSVSAHGLGIIISREVETVSPGKDNVTVVVRHTDYNPDIRGLSSFDVEYRCPWSPLMEKLQPLLLPNREVSLVGHIIGKDMSKHMWIVEITGVSVTSGPGNTASTAPAITGETIVTPGGRSRGKMIFDDHPPIQGSSKDVESPATDIPQKKPTPKKRARATPPKKGPALNKKKPKKKVTDNPDVVPEPDPAMSEPLPTNTGLVKGKGKGPAIASDDEHDDSELLSSEE